MLKKYSNRVDFKGQKTMGMVDSKRLYASKFLEGGDDDVEVSNPFNGQDHIPM